MGRDAGTIHPDAEVLAAFAEQSVTAAEREHIMVHLAACRRCREVVFLAQQAAAEEKPVAVPFGVAKAKEDRQRWLDWRWGWIPAAALAAFVGVAVVAHYRIAAPESQMAKNTTATNASLRQAESSSAAAPTSAPVTQPKPAVKEKDAARPFEQFGPRREHKEETKSLDEKDAGRRDEGLATAGALGSGAGGARAGVAGASGQAPGGAVGGAFHGAATTPSNVQSIGGPMVANQNQLQSAAQQKATQQNAPQQNAVQLADSLQSYDARKPAAKTAPTSMNETVAVETTPQAPAAEPAPAKQSELTQATTQSLDLEGRSMARLKKAPSITLPNGLGVLSSATSQGHMIALDTNGVLFVSDDSGKNWKAVNAQWTGRAVLVRARQIPASLAPGFAAVQTSGFELVTDKLQTWTSVDGKTWTSEPVPAK